MKQFKVNIPSLANTSAVFNARDKVELLKLICQKYDVDIQKHRVFICEVQDNHPQVQG
jgi:hypothetical protein|tara:strand:- start:408 stop:581 length:174 start_codon:yes stop_codon:yes gene_type:complete